MSKLTQHDGRHRPVPTARVIAAVLSVALLIVLIVAAARWLASGRSISPQAAVLTLQSEGQDDVAFEAPASSPNELNGSLPGADAPPVDALAAIKGPRTIHGVAVRASDQSAIGSATVILLHHDVESDVETELARGSTEPDGSFSLRVEDAVDAFRVLAAAPIQTRAATLQEGIEPVRVEWADDTAASNKVRLVLDTGWRLDVRVVDGEGHARAGALVVGGNQSVTTDPQGRCALLDLPTGGRAMRLAVQPVADAAYVSQTVSVPEAGQLRKEATLTVP